MKSDLAIVSAREPLLGYPFPCVTEINCHDLLISMFPVAQLLFVPCEI